MVLKKKSHQYAKLCWLNWQDLNARLIQSFSAAFIIFKFREKLLGLYLKKKNLKRFYLLFFSKTGKLVTPGITYSPSIKKQKTKRPQILTGQYQEFYLHVFFHLKRLMQVTTNQEVY